MSSSKPCTHLFAVFVIAGLIASTGCEQEESGYVSVHAQELILGGSITRMTLTALPEGLNAELTRNGNEFTGTLLVPAGPHTFQVRAFVEDTQVGFGTATATVAEGAVTALQITVLDTTGPAPAPGHSPFVTALTVSNTQPKVGEAVQLTANVVDPDGDSISYAWTSSCPASRFTPSDAATVSWSSSQPGACTLRLDITAGEHTLSRLVNVVVFDAGNPTGAIDVTATFVSNPRIEAMTIEGRSGAFRCSVLRFQNDASCQTSTGTGATHDILVNFLDSGSTVALRDNCGGQVLSSRGIFFVWQAPASPAVCLLTATATNAFGLTDNLSLAFQVR